MFYIFLAICCSWILNLTKGGLASPWTVPEMSIDGKKIPSTTPISLPGSLQVVSAKTDDVDYQTSPGGNRWVETEEPYFDAEMQATYTAYLGKTAIITCFVHAVKNEKSVSWIRSRDVRILAVGRYTYASDLRFEAIHPEGSNKWLLRIRSVQRRDAGTYECQITTKPIKTFTVVLNIVEPTVEIMGSPDIFVNRASMINLTCVVHYAPVPPQEMIWYHGNKTIGYTSPRGGVSVVEERGERTTSYLLLQNARPSDTGRFTCAPTGMEATVVNLHVLEEGEHPAAMQTNASPHLTSTIFVCFIGFGLRVFFRHVKTEDTL